MKAVAANTTTAHEWSSEDGGFHRLTGYFGDPAQILDGPQGFLVEHYPAPDVGDETAIVSHPHYHRVRQFQLVVHGDRPTFGKRSLEPIAFHYTDPSTPYGPISAGKGGVGYFTLRAKADVGQYKMPGEKERMLVSPRRNIAVQVAAEGSGADAEVETLIEPQEDGLASYYLRLAPGAEAAAPSGEGGGGQYHVVVKGSAVSNGAQLPPRSLAWVDPGESAPTFKGGPEGAEVVVLQFPVPQAESEIVDPDAPGQPGKLS